MAPWRPEGALGATLAILKMTASTPDPAALFAPLLAEIRALYGPGPIPRHRPVFEGPERRWRVDCIDSNFMSSVGARVTEFEERKALAKLGPNDPRYPLLWEIRRRALWEVKSRELRGLASARNRSVTSTASPTAAFRWRVAPYQESRSGSRLTE